MKILTTTTESGAKRDWNVADDAHAERLIDRLVKRGTKVVKVEIRKI